MAKLKSDRSLKAVYVSGLDELMKKIKEVNPDAQKLFKKEVKSKNI